MPEDIEYNVFLTEAQKNLTTGNLEIALSCANKAVENAQVDPRCLLVRSQCLFTLGRHHEALKDATQSLKRDPSMIKALLVQAESLYAMGEFEKSLVIFYRGMKRRNDLEEFRKGIQKAKEAILNAIGSNDFPSSLEMAPKSPATPFASAAETKLESTAASLATRKRKGLPEKSLPPPSGGLRSSRQTQGLPKPFVTSIQTNKMASKKLLGGLSSDKEFLCKLLHRKDLESVLVSKHVTLPVERPQQVFGKKKRPGDDKDSVDQPYYSPPKCIIETAQEALTSLQHLEAFLWQRDPGGLVAPPIVKPPNYSNNDSPSQFSRNRNLPQEKKEPLHPHKGRKNTPAAARDKRPTSAGVTCQVSFKKYCHKVDCLIKQLETSEGEALTSCLEDAESFLEVFRRSTEPDLENYQLLCRLLVGIGAALPKNGRSDDGMAVLLDASNLAMEKNLLNERCRAEEIMGKIHSSQGHQDKAIQIWSALLQLEISDLYRAQILNHMATVQIETGNIQNAKEVVTLCAKKYEDAGMKLEAVQILLEYAQAQVQCKDKEVSQTYQKIGSLLQGKNEIPEDLKRKLSTMKGFTYEEEDHSINFNTPQSHANS